MAEVDPNAPRILIADDDAIQCMLLEKILLQAGYQVAFAHDGEEALKVAFDCKPDLVLLDLNMPQLNGIEVCGRLQLNPETKSTPVIMVSASDSAEDKALALRFGAVDYLVKPFNPRELLARITAMLRVARREQSIKSQLGHFTQEMELAKGIQRQLVPPGAVSGQGFQVHGLSKAAEFLSGDYFDYTVGPQGVTCFIGDVSGKGVPASMLMVMARLFFRYWQYDPVKPADCLLKLNRILFENSEKYMFMTALWLHATSDGRVVYAGAGHEKLLVYRGASGTVETLNTGGVVLGLRANIAGQLRQQELKLVAGDALLVYTDGVTDAASPSGARLELEGLGEILKRVGKESAEAAVTAVLEDVTEFGALEKQEDDQTLLVLKYTGTEAAELAAEPAPQPIVASAAAAQ